jgi:GntR family transcriptional regulator
MILTLSELSPEPLHAQIRRQLRARILAHELTDDEPLPSIRGLARDQRVSVITVQRAYEDLERDGLVRSRPGKGFFVMAIPEQRKQLLAEERYADVLGRVLAEARADGLETQRLRDVFERVLQQKGDGR